MFVTTADGSYIKGGMKTANDDIVGPIYVIAGQIRMKKSPLAQWVVRTQEAHEYVKELNGDIFQFVVSVTFRRILF